MKYEAEILYLEIIYDSDFDYRIEICVIQKKLVEFDEVVILKTRKT